MAAVHLAARRLDAGAKIYMAAHDTAEWQRPFHRAGACRRCLRVGEPVYRPAFADCGADCLGFRGQYHRPAVGTWAGNPISFPFIWLTTFNIGHLILGTEDKAGDLPELSLGLFIDAPISALLPVILPMAVGGLVVGTVMAVATYYPSLWAVRFYQKRRRDKLERAQAGTDNKLGGKAGNSGDTG